MNCHATESSATCCRDCGCPQGESCTNNACSACAVSCAARNAWTDEIVQSCGGRTTTLRTCSGNSVCTQGRSDCCVPDFGYRQCTIVGCATTNSLWGARSGDRTELMVADFTSGGCGLDIARDLRSIQFVVRSGSCSETIPSRFYEIMGNRIRVVLPQAYTLSCPLTAGTNLSLYWRYRVNGAIRDSEEGPLACTPNVLSCSH